MARRKASAQAGGGNAIASGDHQQGAHTIHWRMRSRQTAFVRAMAATCNVEAAASAAQVKLATCYRWRVEQPGFAARWDRALAMGYDRLEAALLGYALGKVERAVADRAASAVGDTVDDSARDGARAAAPVERTVGAADLQLASRILLRHRAARTTAAAKQAAAPTEAETDAVLKRALDGLARRAKA